MKLIAVKCPQCDATIDIDENRKSCFCSYCGAKIIIDDGSRTYTHVFIDKTREKEIELEKLKLAKEEENRRLRIEAENRRNKQIMICKMIPWISLVFAIIFVSITVSIIGTESHVLWNYIFMLMFITLCLLGVLTEKKFHGVTLISIMIIVSSICFMFLRSNFKSSLGAGIFFVVVSVVIASIVVDS